MGRVKRSRTAQGVAAERALLTDMGVLTDPFARGMLTTPWRVFVSVVEHLPERLRPWSVTRAGLGARVLWFDAQVVHALDAGITQVAVIGAGYDSRAWRLRRDGVAFFEVDHETTQQDKVRRVPDSAPTYVPADLATQTAADALLARGFDPSRRAIFVLEGVTMYLSEDAVRRQLGALAASSAAGSRLAVDFSPPPDIGTSGDRRRMVQQRAFAPAAGRPYGCSSTVPTRWSSSRRPVGTSLRKRACAKPRALSSHVHQVSPSTQ